MNKIIYKIKHIMQSKIALALLVLGGAVSNVGVVSSTSSSSSPYPAQEIQAQEGPVTGFDNPQLGITANPSQIRASNISGNSLAGSSGDTTTAQSTQVETGTTLTVINSLNGTRLLRSTKLHYREVIAKIREQLGQGLIIKLTQNGQVIPSNTPDKLEGEIGYTVQGSIISVIPSSPDELRRALQGFIHEDFFNLHSTYHLRMGSHLFHHINATRVVESAPWVEGVDKDGYLLETEALQSDLIETLKVLCDNIDNNSKAITTLRECLAKTPIPLWFDFSLSTESPNIILIVISTPPEYDLRRDLAFLDQDGNLVLGNLVLRSDL